MSSQTTTNYIINIRSNLNEPVTDYVTATVGVNYLNSELLEYLNKAKDRLWDIIRQVREDYFETTSDTSITLVTATKEYTLPSTFRQLKGIKITQSGFESLRLRWVDQSSEEFKRRDSLPSGSTVVNDLVYDIIGVGVIKFADFPPASLTTSIDYIAWIVDFVLGSGTLAAINDEWREYIEAYATMKALGKNPSDPRLKFWIEEVGRLHDVIISGTSKRNIRDTIHVEAYDPF